MPIQRPTKDERQRTAYALGAAGPREVNTTASSWFLRLSDTSTTSLYLMKCEHISAASSPPYDSRKVAQPFHGGEGSEGVAVRLNGGSADHGTVALLDILQGDSVRSLVIF